MNSPQPPQCRPDFRNVARHRYDYTDADLATISRAAHALKHRDPISMTGAVIIASAVLTGVGIAAAACTALGLPFDSPVAWICLAMPVLLVASIVYASSRASGAPHDRAAQILLDAGLCANCAAPLPSAPRIDRATCARCNAIWTLTRPISRPVAVSVARPVALRPRPLNHSTRTHASLARYVQVWQRDALGVRVPVAAAFADSILEATPDPALRDHRSACFTNMSKGIDSTNRITTFGIVGFILCAITMAVANGILSGLASAGTLASSVAIIVGRLSIHAATRDSRITMLGARLCPCCAEDLDANATAHWQGQPMVQCNRCSSQWYLPIAGSTYVPQPGRSTCSTCGYALSGLTPDAAAMVTCPECARRCPLPGHAACAVCETALLADAKQLYRGIHCPKCRTLNRVGSKGIEFE